MSLEAGRNLFRGILILLSVTIAYSISLTVGLVLVAFVGVMILQSVITDWCPADFILRWLGLRKKLEPKNQRS